MSVFKCKMCGATLNISEKDRVIQCEYCFTQQTIPTSKSERITNLFNRANALRFNKDFDKSAGVYESIVAECPDEAEAYWGLCLCKYGIEYVDDTRTGKKIPTCHRTLTTPILNDPDYLQVCKYSDDSSREIYAREAGIIAQIQKEILAIAATATPYDIFICYKETDDLTGMRTEDSIIAQDIYTELIQEGYKVFFARVSLRDVAGSKYEPYIFSALSTAKVMLVIGTDDQYFNAVWVKNEWARYLKMMNRDKNKHLIPCYKNVNPYQMPGEFSNLQALDMGSPTFYKNLTANITRYLAKTGSNNNNVNNSYRYTKDENSEIIYQNGKQLMRNNPALAINSFSEIPNYKNSKVLLDACKNYQHLQGVLMDVDNKLNFEQNELSAATETLNSYHSLKKRGTRALIIFLISFALFLIMENSYPNGDSWVALLLFIIIYGAVQRVRIFKKSKIVSIILACAMIPILIVFPITAISSISKIKRKTRETQQVISNLNNSINANLIQQRSIQDSLLNIKALADR